VDEVGFDTFLYREYGRSLKGQSVPGTVSGRKFKRTNIVAGKCEGNIVAPLQYTGSTDSKLFEFWFEEILLKAISKGSFIVMDNASFHRKAVLHNLAAANGCFLVFLPPYSPDLNPIENFWAWLKRKLKDILPAFPNFDLAIAHCFQVR
jgi:transposase